MTDTKIEWTHMPGTVGRSWNPTRGCLRTSPGCGGGKVEGAGGREGGCYAERTAARFSGPGQPYEGLVRMTAHGPRWTGKGRLVEEKLDEPLRWRERSTVFVNLMSDLFFEAFTDEEIAAVFGVMAAAQRHTFVVLTKRARRMREWFQRALVGDHEMHDPLEWVVNCADERDALHGVLGVTHGQWPLPNVILGVSCERQQEADKRIPDLLATPAAVRMVSAEPLLGPIDFKRFLPWRMQTSGWNSPSPMHVATLPAEGGSRGLDWVVAGGESGPDSRPCDVEWIRSIVRQCKAADTRVFVKQLGAYVRDRNDAGFDGEPGHAWNTNGTGIIVEDDSGGDHYQGADALVRLRSRKGGDMAEWPEDLRVREWPALGQS